MPLTCKWVFTWYRLFWLVAWAYLANVQNVELICDLCLTLQAVTLWKASVCSRGITLFLLSQWPRACSTFGSWRACRALSPPLLCCPTRPSTCGYSRSRDCQVTFLVFVSVCTVHSYVLQLFFSGLYTVCVSARTTSCFPSQTPPECQNSRWEHKCLHLTHRGECERVCACVCVCFTM